MDGRSRLGFVATAVVSGALASAVGCQHIGSPEFRARYLSGREDQSAATVTPLESDELALVVSRLDEEPSRLGSSAQRLRVSVFYDPQLVQLPRVATYRLWTTSEGDNRWTQVAEVAPGQSVEVPLTVGVQGLAASVLYQSGEEAYVPERGSPPQVWLHASLTDSGLPETPFEREPEDSLVAPTLTEHRPEEHRPELGEHRPGEQRNGDAPTASTAAGGTDEAVSIADGTNSEGTGAESGTSSEGTPPGGGSHGSATAYDSKEFHKVFGGESPPPRPFLRDMARNASGKEGVPVRAIGPSDAAATASSGSSTVTRERALRGNVASEDSDAAATAPPAVSAAGDVGPTLPADRAAGASVEAPPEAPSVVLQRLPEAVGRELSLLISVTDPNQVGIERVEAYLRRESRSQWRRLAPSACRLDGDDLKIDLSGFDEGTYELYLRAVDQEGNAAPAAALAQGELPRFELDLSAPALTARASTLDWVGGFATRIHLQVDWADAVPPVLVEGRTAADGAWAPLGRFSEADLGGAGFASIDVPLGVERYSLRCSVADDRGNVAESVIGPREVKPSLEFASFDAPNEYPEGSSAPIRWQLHPVAEAAVDTLRVSIWHQAEAAGPWTLLFDELPADSESYWDLPPHNGGTHRLRARLFQAGKTIGEAHSANFTIAKGERPSPTLIPISAVSRQYLRQAESLVRQYDATLQVRQAGVENDEALAKLEGDVAAEFQKALKADSNNYKASYGLALFYNRVAPEKYSAEVSKLLSSVVDIKPDHFWALNDLGAVSIRTSSFKDAEAALTRAVALEDQSIAYYNLGLARFYQRKWAASRESFERALEAGGNYKVPPGEVYYYYIHSYLQEGDLESARREFQKRRSEIPEELRAKLAENL